MKKINPVYVECNDHLIELTSIPLYYTARDHNTTFMYFTQRSIAKRNVAREMVGNVFLKLTI